MKVTSHVEMQYTNLPIFMICLIDFTGVYLLVFDQMTNSVTFVICILQLCFCNESISIPTCGCLHLSVRLGVEVGVSPSIGPPCDCYACSKREDMASVWAHGVESKKKISIQNALLPSYPLERFFLCSLTCDTSTIQHLCSILFRLLFLYCQSSTTNTLLTISARYGLSLRGELAFIFCLFLWPFKYERLSTCCLTFDCLCFFESVVPDLFYGFCSLVHDFQNLSSTSLCFLVAICV